MEKLAIDTRFSLFFRVVHQKLQALLQSLVNVYSTELLSEVELDRGGKIKVRLHVLLNTGKRERRRDKKRWKEKKPSVQKLHIEKRERDTLDNNFVSHNLQTVTMNRLYLRQCISRAQVKLIAKMNLDVKRLYKALINIPPFVQFLYQINQSFLVQSGTVGP